MSHAKWISCQRIFDIDQKDLQVKAEISWIKRTEIELSKKDQEEELLEQQLVSKLADLQREIAIRCIEYDETVDQHRIITPTKVEKLERKETRKAKRLKLLLEQTKRESLDFGRSKDLQWGKWLCRERDTYWPTTDATCKIEYRENATSQKTKRE